MRKLISGVLLGAIAVGTLAPAALAEHRYDYYPYRHYYRRPRRHDHHSNTTRDVLIGTGVGILIDRTILRSKDRDRDRNRDDRRDGAREPAPPPPAARADDLRVERLRQGRVKVAWMGDDQDVESLELFVADRHKEILDSERIRERPYAATLTLPPADGYVGVMLNYPDGSTTSVYLPAESTR
ncbi:MAG: hypothetical protein HY320_13595 [Armatimonadetes bacterium]|nr:hypothetical protein [Armatimonadota bacterium]